MKFDLYDFDKTVFPVDSESVFYLFCLVRHPWLIVILPYQLVCLACFFLKIGGDKMKGRFFCFLRFVNTEKMVKKFWEKNEKRIYPFFRPEFCCARYAKNTRCTHSSPRALTRTRAE